MQVLLDVGEIASRAHGALSSLTPYLLSERYLDEAAVTRILGAVGPFDHIVTAAAGTARGTVAELDTTAARALFESKYWDSSSITLFSGWIGRKPMVGTSTRAAIEALTR